MIIDAHLHIWDPARSPYVWLHSAGGALERRVDFAEVEPALDEAGVDGVVLVQADDDDGDTDLMLEVAAENPRVVGVVAYAPLHHPATAALRLEALSASPVVVGIRNLIHDRQDPDWLLRDDVDEGLGLLEAAGIPFDLVGVLPRHLALVPIVSERHPSLRIVLDHLTNPPLGEAGLQPWWDLVAAAAENPLVYAKVSGLYLSPGAPSTLAQIRPAVERAVEVFGATRLMYGGDWPVSTSYGGYSSTWNPLQTLFREMPPDEYALVTGGTATEFYRPDPHRLAAARSHTRRRQS